MTSPAERGKGPSGPTERETQGPSGPTERETQGPLPAEAFAAALAGLPSMGPGRLAALLRKWAPAEAWARVAAGEEETEVSARWCHAARATDVAALWRAHVQAGVRVHVLGTDDYPETLAGDHQAPAVVFSRGDPTALDHRRAAIVGTRRCTRYGRELASELGNELAAQGVAVVSGLALGVDGAAHTGALAAGAAPPVAVVGSGLDVVYPRLHRDLWSRVARAGLLLSEAPLGAAPESWRFPIRNRIIAALAEVVVVVESHARGGCLHTVDAASVRGRTVMAVPGSVRSSASCFPNSLLADGCAPARDSTDVLVALGLSTCASGKVDARPPPSCDSATVLEAVGWEPASLEEIVLRSGLGVAAASMALVHLERDGWVAIRAGWWERVAAP